MAKTATILRVFIASPSDVAEERKALEDVIRELNLAWRDSIGIILEPIKWETHAFPGISEDAQAVINEEIADDYDIFIGMLWTRFGTPTKRSASGTQEEFEKAYSKWKATPENIRIMIYFNNSPIAPDNIDPDQLTQVKTFRKELGEKGVLYWHYASLDEFSSNLRIHLSRQIQEWRKSWGVRNTLANSIVDVTKEQSQILIAQSDEEGFLDLVERNSTETARVTEVTQHMGQALNGLSAKVNEATEELNSVSGDSRAKLAAYKRISNRIADTMGDFVQRMRPELPILRGALYHALDTFGKTVSLLPDFGVTPENLHIVNRSLEALLYLKSAIIPSQESFRRLRTSTARLPKMTTQFNRARREILEILDDYLEIVEQGLNQIPEIETNTRSIIEVMSNNNGQDLHEINK